MEYVPIYADEVALIQLGYTNENSVTKVIFTDFVETCIDTFGEGGVFTLVVTNPSYEDGYPAPVTYNSTDKTVEWVVVLSQLVSGDGECQMTYTLNSVQVKKSGHYQLHVTNSLAGGETAPTSYTPWLQVAEGYKNDAQAAKTAAETAQAAAEEAQAEVEEALDDYYTKDETDSLLSTKANASDVYTKTQTDTLLGAKADASSVYTKTEADALLDTKANSSDVYTKTQVYTKTETDNLLNEKADSDDVYTKDEIKYILAHLTWAGIQGE